MKRNLAISLLVSISGVAIACNGPLPLPIPPVPVSISLTNIAGAWLKGYHGNAGYAAAAMKIDSLAQTAVGSSKWYSTSYAGYFTYTVTLGGATGANRIYVEKSCNQNLIDNVSKSGGTSGGGAGGGVPVGGGGGCGGTAVTGITGWESTAVVYNVCTDAGCSSGTYMEYTPVFGPMSKSGSPC